MYNFLLCMWIDKRINEDYLNDKVAKGRINENEKEMILSIPQRV